MENAKVKITIVKIVYYSSFAGYFIPIKPIGPINKEDAINRKTYCIGYYDVECKLIRYEKYLDGALFLKQNTNTMIME